MISEGDGALLDVGCGAGALTDVCHQLGWNATGVDVSADGLALGRTRFPGVRFVEGSAYDDLAAFAPPGGFDVVISSEVIEHLYRPALMLERTYDALRPGGRLLITTPYHGYLLNLALSLANRWDARFDVQRDGWHIKFFSRRTLTDMVADAGFEVVEWRGLGRVRWLWWSQALLARKPDPAAV
jgi:2-polyprenyl-6-hydroxyphenyl methylase/3-demethylubiquinone-9 3-methyltransferase